MPAYYYAELYVDKFEDREKTIIASTVDSMVNCGFKYHDITVTRIEDDSLPRGKQRPIQESLAVTIKEAVDLAVKDISEWYDPSGKKWLSGVQFNFHSEFSFNPNTLAEMSPSTREEAKLVRVSFKIRNPQEEENSTRDLVIRVRCWEEYVMIYGETDEQKINKENIVRLCGVIAGQTEPYFGFLDGEANGDDVSFNNVNKGIWPFGNEYVILGKSILERTRKYKYSESEKCTHLTTCGVLIMKGR